MHASSDWLKKGAVKWTWNDCTSGPYWGRELISLISSLDDESTINGNSCSISYGALLVAAVAVYHTLRQRLDDMLLLLASQQQQQQQQQQVGVPIVVAIPEGPLLPLAILVVHLLNEPMMMSGYYIVLVPLEPEEGKERLVHMLMDCRPAMVLSVPGTNDWNKLADLVASMEAAADLTVTKNGLYRARKSVLVDFHEVVRGSIVNHTNSDDVCSLKQTLRETVNDNLLESLVGECHLPQQPSCTPHNRISHVVYTSGTTGRPKGCISSIQSLRHYLSVKNEAHGIASSSVVLLASALSFDPCLSDILATLRAKATLGICPRKTLVQHLATVVQRLQVTHVLCTPTLWEMVHSSGVRPRDLLSLQVVALGGEPIPQHITKTWASRDNNTNVSSGLRLCATYGVTEACVYQTFGEVRDGGNDDRPGQNVGKALRGLYVRICDETDQTELKDTVAETEDASIGEIVLSGMQLDEYSAYLNMETKSREKFVSVSSSDNMEPLYFYRTGDRGYIDTDTGDLYVVGRIQGEDGMVKVNGVRIELGEIEAALIDGDVVVGCLAVDRTMDNGSKQIHAYCVLSNECLQSIGIGSGSALESGVLLTTGPLLLLLRARCMDRVRAGVMPTVFVIIERLPLSPTGKRDRRRLPSISECASLDARSDASSTLLWEHGRSGAVVAKHLIECLNLQPCQRSILTTNASFGMLGGDSLAATRVTRSLFAHHHNVSNSRFLGGEHGMLEGPFAVVHLLRAKNMGEYVDFLDSEGVCSPVAEADAENGGSTKPLPIVKDNAESTSSYDEKDLDLRLYDALLEAATSGQSLIAVALLDQGVDPNMGKHGGRLSKVSDRRDRKRMFRSNPLHLACSRGDSVLVKKLLEKGCEFNSPDASGSFPIHLAASGTLRNQIDSFGNVSAKEEDLDRCECVQALLDAGAPLAMMDGNKQTVFHCAARAGHCQLLVFLMDRCKQSDLTIYNWHDRWFRKPVHWAVLNGRVQALRDLLDNGCDPDPPKPKKNKQTSVAIESPIEICDRLYGESDAKGKEMRQLLLAAIEVMPNE